MSLTLVRDFNPDGIEICLCDGGRKLAARKFDLLTNDHDLAVWDSARELLMRHDRAVELEQATEMPGALPLPPDHVPAAEYFMAAVQVIFPTEILVMMPKSYRTEVQVRMWDDESGRPQPAVDSVINVTVDELDDPLQSLTIAALERALLILRSSLPYSGGRI